MKNCLNSLLRSWYQKNVVPGANRCFYLRRRPSSWADSFKRFRSLVRSCQVVELAQKEYKTRYDWLGKVIHWEMWKKLKFDHPNKWYMHKPAPVLENDTHKLLWDFDIQTDHRISARRSDPIIINNNNNNKKRELSKLSTLLSRLTTEQNWKIVKRRISTSTLLENWQNYGICRWQLYQL